MQFDIGMHTIILLVGPSQSGKSTWASIFKEKMNQLDEELRVSIISSDTIRRQLLGENLDRYDPKMMEVSECAFDMLFAQLKAVTQYPVNNEFVVIDTTGLDAEFRKKIQDHAKTVCYRTAIVAFDYAHSEYFKDLEGYNAKHIVSKHVDTFKKTVLPSIKRKSYDFSLTVKERNLTIWKDMIVNTHDYPVWRKCNFTNKVLDTEQELMIIGDVHEHMIPVQQLVEKNPDKKIFFVGDIIDKGNNTKQAIEETVELMKKGAILVRGNHESFVARRIKGEITPLDNEDELFPSLKEILADQELKEKFMWLYEESLPFACIKTHCKTIYITHAPCYNKYIGKLDNNSQKYQRNFYFSSRDKNDMIDDLSCMKNEEKYSHPMHVFGHVAHGMKQVEYKNKVWLDTGSVYGNKLTALIIDKKGNKKYVHEKTSVIYEGELFSMQKSEKFLNEKGILIETKEDKPLLDIIKASEESKNNIKKKITDIIDKNNLSSDARYWLHNFNESGAQFISGTMSPSKASATQLEPIETAIDYFYTQGVDKVIIQPKYMGSRLQIYLFRESGKDFAITRSGHKLGHADKMSKVFKSLHEKYDNQDFWQDSIIFDGELLPWSMIAQELIEKDFLQYGKSIKQELNILNDDMAFKAFNLDGQIVQKTEMIDTFIEQASWFGQSGEVQYKPFSILKVDNEIWIDKNQEEIFKLISNENEPYLVIDTSKESYAQAVEFFKELTQKMNQENLGNEGIVMKPLLWKKGVAPYMKVRNEQYLHLIYGYDYKLHYQEKLKNKRINKKLELSVKEYELGIDMLRATTKSELLSLACQINFEIEKEKQLDIRL